MNLQNKLIKLYNEIDGLKNKRSSSDSDFKACLLYTSDAADE